MQAKIAHLTSVHPRYDTRIFVKMCSSLANKYYVSLVVANGEGSETKNGVHIIDVGPSTGRLNRILKAPNRVFTKAIDLDADIYHLYNPESMRIEVKLKKARKNKL